jgi:hypothetical protein
MNRPLCFGASEADGDAYPVGAHARTSCTLCVVELPATFPLMDVRAMMKGMDPSMPSNMIGGSAGGVWKNVCPRR